MESKKRGRPEGKNFEFIKSIKLNQEQIDNWDSKKVKAFLDGSLKPIEPNSEVMDKFKRLYEIMTSWLLGKMTDDQISLIPDKVLDEIDKMVKVFNLE